MLALYRSGRQAEALEAIKGARRVLTDELGIELGRELRELERKILLQDPSLDSAAPGIAVDAEDGAFVGREDELQQLVAALDEALAGRGRVVLIAGEPGIGKSRLCEELIAHARARRARVLVGRCWEAGGAPAYWPWIQALRTYLQDSSDDAARVEVGIGAEELVRRCCRSCGICSLTCQSCRRPSPRALAFASSTPRRPSSKAFGVCPAARSRPRRPPRR